MAGLILKDILNLKKQAKVYLILVIFYFAIGVVNENSSMFSSMMTMVAVMIPITAMSYDERSKWDRYALTMPISRASIVVSRYLLGVIFLIIAYVLSILVNMVFSRLYTTENILINIASLSAGITIMSAIFPILFKFGVEKGRILMMLVLFVPIAFVAIASKLGISMPDEETIKSFIYLSPIIAAVIFLVSIYISLSIYKKKEF
jgi:ABC-type transport system involved in multi-copper enzyme maturation permease subunit